MDFLRSSDEILTVGEFSRRFKTLLKTRVPEMWIRAEVSNVRVYPSGHTYFTAKDSEASFPAVLFKGYSGGVGFKLADGMKVLLFAEVSFYETRGTCQFVVKALMRDGLGDLARRFEELKQKLSAEGLFEASRKIPVPKLVGKVAVVTSPVGAAVRDFLRILERRGWRGLVCVIPSKVQGAEAAAEIADALAFADRYVFADGSKFDAVVAMRGGGSLEDLFAFNEECVARAVAAMELPVISAVGHEIDFTLSDFAADLRAETPSAAAEVISSSYIECVSELENCAELARDYALRRFESERMNIELLGERLARNSPEQKINSANMRLDELSGRLRTAVLSGLAAARLKLSVPSAVILQNAPLKRIEILRQKLDSLGRQAEILSVDGTLKRGFALVTDASGKVIARAKNLRKADRLNIKFFDGSKEVEVL